jgi:hypothetical protein
MLLRLLYLIIWQRYLFLIRLVAGLNSEVFKIFVITWLGVLLYT